MREISFNVEREMSGDRFYRTGESRDMIPLDAIHLVRSGALTPETEDGKKIMAELMNETPEDRSGVIQQVKEDAPRNKDAGNAPANKAGRPRKTATAPAPAPAPAPPATSGPATGTGSGGDGAGGGTLTTSIVPPATTGKRR